MHNKSGQLAILLMDLPGQEVQRGLRAAVHAGWEASLVYKANATKYRRDGDEARVGARFKEWSGGLEED